ncbi:DUF177 domain-containing protein [Cognatishimia sp.]|uniref:YceD family protein n=1 Tax=Cognatishimia sp. TaxID=2211648 RepID=UPI003512B516
MSGSNSAKTTYAVAELPQNKATFFKIAPETAALKELASDLDILDLKKLRFEGEIKARGKRDWTVKGHLGVTVVQACVVSLDPVTTRIEADVERVFVANYTAPTEEEYEMTEEDSADPLGETIDLSEILFEEIGLNLPLYPRADDADLGESVFSEPGIAPMRDEDARPFAGLAGLRDQLANKDDK